MGRWLSLSLLVAFIILVSYVFPFTRKLVILFVLGLSTLFFTLKTLFNTGELTRIQDRVIRLEAQIAQIVDGENHFIGDKSGMFYLKKLRRWADDAKDVFDLNGRVNRLRWNAMRRVVARESYLIDGIPENIVNRYGLSRHHRYVFDSNAHFRNKQPGIYGRTEVQKKILESLISKVDKVTILPIVGRDGVGKTTLAHWVYSHPTIPDKFDIKGWANCGSCAFDLTSLLKTILEAFAKKPFVLIDLESLKRKIQEEVLGRRFLLVLDNVSEEMLSLLCDERALFSGAHLGKILVTARQKDVVSLVKDKVEPPLVLGCLDDNNSWLLLRDCISENYSEMDYNSTIVRELAFKCGGLPLSIRALGSALSFLYDKEKISGILDSNIWKSDKIDGDGILPALEISYSSMNVELKRCFVLLSLFPKGHVFYENDVVRLWMSLGLATSYSHDRPRERAQSYFKELLQKSMIENAQGEGENSGFTMHDLVHDFTKVYAWDDFLAVHAENIDSAPRHVRYLSILVSNQTNSVDLVPLQEHGELRVLQILHQRNKWKNNRTPITKIKLSNRLFRNLIHLKALVLSMTWIEALPDSVGKLKLLRYLDLKNTGIERLPDNICNLFYLHTLDVTNCPLRELPKGIKNLVNLEYLVFEWKFSLCMPHGIGKLQRLRMLPRFDIKKGNWHCKINELKGLKMLNGELCIAGLGNIALAEEINEGILEGKPDLTVLRLDWTTGRGRCSHLRKGNEEKACASAEHVFHTLKPRNNLEALHINGYPCMKHPSWLGCDSFYKLVKISLVGPNNGCKTLPPLGGMHSLKALFIKSMSNVPTVGHEFYCCSAAFPSLEILKFDDMSHWLEWHAPDGHAFNSLRTLTITDCPELKCIPYPLTSSLTTMVSLSLKGKINEDLFRFLKLPSMKTLKVRYSGNIRSLPLNSEDVPSLEVLVIHGCRKLQTVVGLRELKSLRILKIHACENLQFPLNKHLPPELTHVAISSCPKLQHWKLFQKRNFNDQLDREEALSQLSDTDTDADDI